MTGKDDVFGANEQSSSEQFSRTAMLFGPGNMEKLFSAKVAVFGIGGVGSYAAEALARSGIGTIDLFDNDLVCLTNINRQMVALHSTVGKYKVDVMRTRILDINPAAKVGAFRMFYLPENAGEVDLSRYDYVVDAVDTVTAKIELIARAKAANVPIICSMGAANKLDPTAFVVTDIHKTEIDALAKVIRKELRVRGIKNVKVVYSKEPARTPYNGVLAPNGNAADAEPASMDPAGASASDAGDAVRDGSCDNDFGGTIGSALQDIGRRQIPASNAFVPPVAGLILAGEVVKDLINS